MGKTLKRQRAREARQLASAAAGEPAAKLPRVAGFVGAALSKASSSSKFSAAVSAALKQQDWAAAVGLLEAMASYGKVPRLGAIQRWVREADQAASQAVTARVIDAVLRTTRQAAAAGGAGEQPAPARPGLQGSVVRHSPWLPEQEAQQPRPGEQQQQEQSSKQQQQQQQQEQPGEQQQQQEQGQDPPPPPDYAALLRCVPYQPGAGGPDAIFTFPPGTLRWQPGWPPVQAVPVPFVPGAVLLRGVLARHECEQILAAAAAIGFNADVDYTFAGAAGDDGGSKHQQQEQPAPEQQQELQALGPAAASDWQAPAAAAGAAAKSAARGLAAGLAGLPEGKPAAGCVWLADESALGPLYGRVRHLLPQEVDGGALAGINARWRIYRYSPGAVYRPHIDGAWPGSGVDDQGRYVFDAHGDRWSRLTFLVYLNSGFEGGCTTFYTPSQHQVGVLDARSVAPVAGNVLVFPHGGSLGSLVHEGSPVLSGAKYVIRTDVLYLKTEGARGRQARPGQASTQR